MTATVEKTAVTSIVPLSETSAGAGVFMQLRYPNTRRGKFHAEPDRVLLDMLGQSCRRAAEAKARAAIESNPEALRMAANSRDARVDLSGEALVRELDEAELRRAVEAVDDRYFEIGWRLAGSEGAPILDRLNQHFAPLLEAKAQADRERAEAIERRLRAEQLRHLQDLRDAISRFRQQIAALEKMISDNQAAIEREAKALGVPAWPKN